jgi:hypothetical protein
VKPSTQHLRPSGSAPSGGRGAAGAQQGQPSAPRQGQQSALRQGQPSAPRQGQRTCLATGRHSRRARRRPPLRRTAPRAAAPRSLRAAGGTAAQQLPLTHTQLQASAPCSEPGRRQARLCHPAAAAPAHAPSLPSAAAADEASPSRGACCTALAATLLAVGGAGGRAAPAAAGWHCQYMLVTCSRRGGARSFRHLQDEAAALLPGWRPASGGAARPPGLQGGGGEGTLLHV